MISGFYKSLKFWANRLSVALYSLIIKEWGKFVKCKEAAAALGQSVNEFVYSAVKEKMAE